MTIALRKSAVRPSASVSRPSPSAASSASKTSRVRLLDLVQQHDAERLLADAPRQLALARRCRQAVPISRGTASPRRTRPCRSGRGGRGCRTGTRRAPSPARSCRRRSGPTKKKRAERLVRVVAARPSSTAIRSTIASTASVLAEHALLEVARARPSTRSGTSSESSSQRQAACARANVAVTSLAVDARSRVRRQRSLHRRPRAAATALPGNARYGSKRRVSSSAPRRRASGVDLRPPWRSSSRPAGVVEDLAPRPRRRLGHVDRGGRRRRSSAPLAGPRRTPRACTRRSGRARRSRRTGAGSGTGCCRSRSSGRRR